MRTLFVFAWLAICGVAQAAETPWLGLQLEEGKAGAKVREVLDGAPAQAAGVKEGDEVLAINEEATANPKAVVAAVRKHQIGETVKVKLGAASGQRTVKITLKPRPDMVTLQRDRLLGKPAPDFSWFETPSAHPRNEPVTKLSALKGQVVLLDFFATWCGPCVASMPHIKELERKYKARGLKIVGISTETAEVVAGAAEKFKLPYSLMSDGDEKVSSSFGVFALPTIVLIDRQGVVREVSVADTDPIDRLLPQLLQAK